MSNLKNVVQFPDMPALRKELNSLIEDIAAGLELAADGSLRNAVDQDFFSDSGRRAKELFDRAYGLLREGGMISMTQIFDNGTNLSRKLEILSLLRRAAIHTDPESWAA